MSAAKVLFINYAFETFTPKQSGALATIIRECSLIARQQGYDPIVMTGRAAAEPYDDVKTIFVDAPRQPQTRLATMLRRAERKVFGFRHMDHRGYVRRVVRAIREANLQGVPMVLQNDPELAVCLRSAFPKAKIVHWFQNQHWAKPRFRKRLHRDGVSIAAVSDFTARWIEGHYGLARDSVRTVHNGVNLRDYFPSDTPPPGKPVINFVGRTGIEKAPDLLLRAALQLSRETKDFSLQLLGSNHWDHFEMDDFQKELASLAGQLEERGIEVRRPGHVDRHTLPAELRQAAIHVVPSRWEEPCALTLFEGLASGLAVVASRTGGTPQIIGNAGCLFTRDDVNELTLSLRMLLSDGHLRNQYAARARRRAEELSWECTWNGLRGLIES